MKTDTCNNSGDDVAAEVRGAWNVEAEVRANTEMRVSCTTGSKWPRVGVAEKLQSESVTFTACTV